MFFDPDTNLKKSKEEENAVKRKVAMAYLIKGGTADERTKIENKLLDSERFYLHGSYHKKNELVVIFSTYHSDFIGMTFDEAKKIAGNSILACEDIDYFGRNPPFAVIDINTHDPQNNSCGLYLALRDWTEPVKPKL